MLMNMILSNYATKTMVKIVSTAGISGKGLKRWLPVLRGDLYISLLASGSTSAAAQSPTPTLALEASSMPGRAF